MQKRRQPPIHRAAPQEFSLNHRRSCRSTGAAASAHLFFYDQLAAAARLLNSRRCQISSQRLSEGSTSTRGLARLRRDPGRVHPGRACSFDGAGDAETCSPLHRPTGMVVCLAFRATQCWRWLEGQTTQDKKAGRNHDRQVLQPFLTKKAERGRRPSFSFCREFSSGNHFRSKHNPCYSSCGP